MGCDLYVKDLDRASQYLGFEVSKNAVEKGYFRDCYNGGGLFAVLSANLGRIYSWWQLKERKGWFEKVEGERVMTVEGAKKFLDIVIDAQAELTNKILKGKVLKYGYKSKEKIADSKQYSEWIQLLVDFLKLAIKIKSTVIWSV